MTNRTLINKYQKYLIQIMDGLEFISDEAGDLNLKTTNRIAKTATMGIKRANSYIESEDIPEEDKELWKGFKTVALSLIEELSTELMGIIIKSQLEGDMWPLLYSAEICSDIVAMLYNEENLLKDTEVNVPLLTQDQLETIQNSI